LCQKNPLKSRKRYKIIPNIVRQVIPRNVHCLRQSKIELSETRSDFASKIKQFLAYGKLGNRLCINFHLSEGIGTHTHTHQQASTRENLTGCQGRPRRIQTLYATHKVLRWRSQWRLMARVCKQTPADSTTMFNLRLPSRIGSKCCFRRV
jgi:hypothetical protein